VDESNTEALSRILERGAASLREARLPGHVAASLERLVGQLDQPCVVAVVGRMKAGKSTFINALLGEDVATIGAAETTATITYLKYGNPDPVRPVRCYFRGGGYEDVGKAFLDGLQGHDLDTLRRAEGISHLEYRLPNPYLERIVLVDTPGTMAVVAEHQNRTAEFLNLSRQLRERHNDDTQRISSEADAVIYLIGPVARATDNEFLEEFTQATAGRSAALNAVGVLSKIDLQPEILARREALAGKIANQFKDRLNTVVPVSAAIYRALGTLQRGDREGVARLMAAFQRIPPPRLAKLLDSEEFYLEMAADDIPVSPEERRSLRDLMGPDVPWTVFTTVARAAAKPGAEAGAVTGELTDLSGFRPLKDVLERHFFQRSRFLRCYRVVRDARKVLSDIRFKHLPEFRKQDRLEKARRDRFLAFIRAAGKDAEVAAELEQFVSLQCGFMQRADRVEAVVKELDRELAAVFHRMGEVNADFEALQRVEKDPALFSPSELEELRRLLGLYGLETAQRLSDDRATPASVTQRQEYWGNVRLRDQDAVRRLVGERAEACYGLLLRELTQG
jgi:hypothetical protein